MDGTGHGGRSRRDWIVDTTIFVLAVLFGLLTASQRIGTPVQPPWLFEVDQVVGALGCAALWLRRRWPVQLAVVMLGGVPDVRVVGEAGDGTEVLPLVDRHAPDVVLMDIRMPGMDGLAATEALRARGRTPEVIVLTTFDADRHVLRALRAGAAGFLLKDTPPDEIVAAVRMVAQGRPVLSPEVTRRLITRVADSDHDRRRDRARARLTLLNDRERDVAVAVGQGRSNAEISAVLHLAVPTVKTHVSNILTKFDLNNRVQIALLAHDAGLLDEG